MGWYVLKRVAFIIPVLIGVMIVIFIVLHISPGDPARMILGESATPEAVKELQARLGLNDPLLVQFYHYISHVVVGDFGLSYMSGAPVLEALLSRYPATLILTGLSVIVMIVIGLPIGIIAATKQYSVLDNTTTTMALIGVSMPTFWLGMLFVLLFSLQLRWLPASGFYSFKYWIMPSLAIGICNAAVIMRMTRSSMLEVVRLDYIKTVRAKGQTERKIIWHHALKNALIPVITIIGLQIGQLMGGAMVTEAVFSIPGVGSYMLGAIVSRDFPVVMGGVILIAATVCILNLLVDITYAFVDPRIRAQYIRRRHQ